MDAQRWEKLAAYTGAVALVLWGAAYIMVGTPPASDAPATEILTWGADKRDSVLLAAYLGGIGGVFFIWWTSSIRSYLRSAEGGTGRLSAIVFAAGILTIAVSTAAEVMRLLLVLRLPEAGNPVTAQLLFDGTTVFYAMSWFPAVAMAAAIGVITMRHGAFPAWFGYVSYAGAIVFLLAGYGISATTGAFASDGAVAMLAFAASTIWYIALLVLLVQRVGKTAAA
jgi:hypothetical protein